MIRYLLRRLLYFVLTCFVVALIAFAVTVSSPGDPVDRLTAQSVTGQEQYSPLQEKEKRRLRHEMGLDLPLFYFSLQSASTPDTLYKVFPATDRENLSILVSRYGHWQPVSAWYTSVLLFEERLATVSRDPVQGLDQRNNLNQLLEHTGILRSTADIDGASIHLRSMEVLAGQDPKLKSLIQDIQVLKENLHSMTSSQPSVSKYIPVLRLHASNRFHQWLFGNASGKGVLRGDFGVSYISRQPVGSYILDRLPWTICFALFAVVLAYAVSIPLALRMVKRPGGALDRRTGALLSLAYSLPVFWSGTLLLMIFSNPHVLPLFPASGVKPVEGYPAAASFFEKAVLSLPYLILPTICYTYAFVAVLTRLLRVSLGQELNKEYIRTASAKGLQEKIVRWHALRNSLLPAVTLFAEVFPLAIGGSILIENIFTIPGMGSGILQSIQAQDYPVLVCIFTLTGAVTMLGYLVTDILYAFLDPRIRYS